MCCSTWCGRTSAGTHRVRCLSLADFTGAQIDKEVATQAKKVLVLDRPYVKRSAWVGTESLPHVFYENFKSFSQRELPTFKTREEAMEFLMRMPGRNSGALFFSSFFLSLFGAGSFHYRLAQ